MITRSILLFPKFDNIEHIHEMRSKYDPLADAIPPHLTLVFPFSSSYTAAEIKQHVQEAVESSKPFDLELRGIVGVNNEYLFLQVQKGREQMIDLHDRLYNGMLESHWRRDLAYEPHLTIGRIQEPEKFQQALQKLGNYTELFTTTISEIYVEVIGSKEESIMESSFRFNNK